MTDGPLLEVRPVLVPPSALLLASPSKSETHRAILIGARTPHTVIDNPLMSEDTFASLRLAEALGARTSAEPATEAGERLLAAVGPGLCEVTAVSPAAGDDLPTTWRALPLSPALGERRVPRPLLAAQVRLHVESTGDPVRVRTGEVDVLNSGTTLRLGTALASLGDTAVTLTGDASLQGRPMAPLLEALAGLGVEVASRDGHAPVTVRGPLRGGTAHLPGHVSSQFVSALLIAAQGASGPVTVLLDAPPRSRPYIELTQRALARFGGVVRPLSDPAASGYRIPAPIGLAATRYIVPGDWSSAAFPLVAAALTGGRVVLAAMERDGPQGDRAILDVLAACGCGVSWEEDPERPGRQLLSVRAPGVALRPFSHGFADTPDLFPALAVLAARCDGTSHLVDAAHVRLKECDRVAAMAHALAHLGVAVEEGPDSLVVHGRADLAVPPMALPTQDDHRVLMALAVLGLVGPGPLWLDGPASYHVSYPRFRTDLDALGGETRVVERDAIATSATGATGGGAA